MLWIIDFIPAWDTLMAESGSSLRMSYPAETRIMSGEKVLTSGGRMV